MSKAEFDLIVVGAGIAGQSVVRAARTKGLSTLLINTVDPMMGSKAAVGVIRVGWFKTPKQKERVRRTIEIYSQNRWLLCSAAEVTTWMRAGIKTEKDHFLVDVPLTLGEPVQVRSLVSKIEFPNVHYGGTSVSAKLGIVVAAGVNTPSFGGPDGRRTYGATYIDAEMPLKTGLVIHRVRPYNCIHAGFGVSTRIGSSSGITVEDSLPRLTSALARCPHTIKVPAGALVVTGARLHSLQYDLSKDYEPFRAFRVTYLAGFGKMGFSLAPAVAEEVVDHYLKRG